MYMIYMHIAKACSHFSLCGGRTCRLPMRELRARVGLPKRAESGCAIAQHASAVWHLVRLMGGCVFVRTNVSALCYTMSIAYYTQYTMWCKYV